MRTKMFSQISALAALLLILCAYAVVPSAFAAQGPSLTEALSQLRWSQNSIAIAIDPDWVSLPRNASLPPNSNSVDEIANAFQQITRRFGSVISIAPSKMVVLNANPTKPNVYASLPPSDALMLFIASLSDSQWQAFTSKEGLALASLKAEMQRQLYQTIIPSKSLRVQSTDKTASFVPGRDTSMERRSELPTSRLRLGLYPKYFVPVKDTTGKIGYDSHRLSGDYYMVADGSDTQEDLFGVRLRAEMPNAPKNGDLNYRTPALRAAISLEDARTVGDAIQRIKETTGLEVYADARLETKNLRIFGGQVSAPAGSLLEALAFSLTATYRKVGPAYVLTDDVIGIGAKREVIRRFEAQGNQVRQEALSSAVTVMQQRVTPDSLKFHDGNPLSQNQMRQATTPESLLSPFDLLIPFGALDTKQQEEARRSLPPPLDPKQEEELRRAGVRIPEPLKLEGAILVKVVGNVQLDLLLPLLNAPVNLTIVPFSLQANLIPRRPEPPPSADPPSEQPSLSAIWAKIPRRGVRLSYDSRSNIKEWIPLLKRLGVDQLWIDFCQPHYSTDADLRSLQPQSITDALTDLVRLGRDNGIRVLPVIHPFSVPSEVRP